MFSRPILTEVTTSQYRNEPQDLFQSFINIQKEHEHKHKLTKIVHNVCRNPFSNNQDKDNKFGLHGFLFSLDAGEEQEEEGEGIETCYSCFLIE